MTLPLLTHTVPLSRDSLTLTVVAKSRVNKYLIEHIEDIGDVTFHDLYQLYPELDIDVKAEQQLLEMHDFIIFHYPFFWYSAPAILKEWQDLVLEHGWAYGHEGKALKDKRTFNQQHRTQ